MAFLFAHPQDQTPHGQNGGRPLGKMRKMSASMLGLRPTQSTLTDPIGRHSSGLPSVQGWKNDSELRANLACLVSRFKHEIREWTSECMQMSRVAKRHTLRCSNDRPP